MQQRQKDKAFTGPPRTRFLLLLAACFCCGVQLNGQTGRPLYLSDVSVHDPSVIHVDDRFYVFGSHLDAAYTVDLRNWTRISGGTGSGNTLIPDLFTQLSEAFAWSGKTSLWAPDVTLLADGRYYMYYCASAETSPRASIGIATADNVEGPYTDQGIILQSGMWGQISPDGTIFDANVHPHAIDPHTFYDAKGRLQMVYGSYSGGIFIMELDPADGTPLPGQGYGTHLWGGNHARIEGPYILYNPDTQYYYLFVSYYGLTALDGYNIRVARSRDPHGPYLDSAGTDMSTVKGTLGTLFDDTSIAPHGVELVGNYRFATVAGEPRSTSTGYLSPGHNSAYHDVEAGKYYLFFHTRFQTSGEYHEVRVHQLYFSDSGWPLVAPHRYAGETRRDYSPLLMEGIWKVINHGDKTRSNQINSSVNLSFSSSGTISGPSTGTWSLADGRNILVTLDGVEYRGVVSHQWDHDNWAWVICFTALSPDGIALWGSQVATNRSSLETYRLIHFGSVANSGTGADTADPNGNGIPNLLEYALQADPLSTDAEERFFTLLDASILSVQFNRIPDPALRYELEAGSRPNAFATIWSSTGTDNEIGRVEFTDPEPVSANSRRFLRLKVSHP